MALGQDGSAYSTATNAQTIAVTLTTADTDDIIVLIFGSELNSVTNQGYITVSSISDTASLTWHRRGGGTAVNNGIYRNIEEWYAISTAALTSDVITVTVTGPYSSGYTMLNAFGVSGANLSIPFDNNSVLPVVSLKTSSGGLEATGVSTNNNTVMAIVGMYAPGLDGNASSLTPGYTVIDFFQFVAYPYDTMGTAYDVLSSALSNATIGWSGPAPATGAGVIVDAINEAGTGGNLTITPAHGQFTFTGHAPTVSFVSNDTETNLQVIVYPSSENTPTPGQRQLYYQRGAEFPIIFHDVAIPSVGRFSVPIFRRNVNFFSLPPEAARVVETNVHFIGKFKPDPYRFSLYPGTPEEPYVIEAQPHFIAKFSPGSLHRAFAILNPPTEDPPVQETNPHFIARYVAPPYTVSLYQGRNNDLPPPQPETNTYFIAKFNPGSLHQPPSLFNPPTEDPPVQETNPHFIARYQTSGLQQPPALRFAPPMDPPVAETNPHFIAKFTPDSLRRPIFWWNPPPEQYFVQSTPPHFLNRFKPDSLRRPISWLNPPPEAAKVVETNPHFLNKFKPDTLRRPTSWFNPPPEAAHVVETNPHFLNRFRPDSLRRPIFWLNPPPEGAIVPSTEPHFIARYVAPPYRVHVYNHQSIDTGTETNTNFIGKFQPDRLSRIPKEWLPAEGYRIPETNVHFIATFRPDKIRTSLYPGPTENEGGIVHETNVSFIGKFRSTAFTRIPYPGQPADLIPEQVPTFIGRFQRDQLARRFADDRTVPPDIVVPDNPQYFIAKFRPDHFTATSRAYIGPDFIVPLPSYGYVVATDEALGYVAAWDSVIYD